MSNKIHTAKTKIGETKAEQEKPKPENNSRKQKCQTKSPQQKPKLMKQKLNRKNQNQRIIAENKNVNFNQNPKLRWKQNEEETNPTQQHTIPVAVRGATNSLEVGCENDQITIKMDTCQQLKHVHNRVFPRQLLYKT